MAITFSSTSYLTTTGAYTNYGTASIAVWCMVTNLHTSSTSSNRIFGTDDLWEIRITTDWTGAGNPRFANELFSSTAQTTLFSTTNVTAATWYHVVFTISGGPGSGAVAQIYINGVLNASSTYTATDTPTGTTLWVGNRSGAASGQCFDGVLDDLRVYNRVLSAIEVQTIYNAGGSDHIWNGCVDRWLMNEGSSGATVSATAGSVKDQCNAFNAASVGSPTYTTSQLQWRRRN